jgi:hypothetical protein
VEEVISIKVGDMTLQDAEHEISKELENGERPLWSGIPRQGFLLRHSDAFVIPFSLLWCGFAIHWERSVLAEPAPFFFKLWGVPFVLAGLYFVLGRFFVDARQRGRTAYGLTNRRIVIVSGVLSRSVKSLQLRTLSDVTLNERSDGSGTITFGPSIPWTRGFVHTGRRKFRRYGYEWPGTDSMSPAFEAIGDAKNVYERIRKAQGAA